MWAATVERKHCCSLSYIRTRSGAHTVQFAMHTHAGAWPVVSQFSLRIHVGPISYNCL